MSGRRDSSTGDLPDLYNTVTSDTVHNVNPKRKRSISFSRNPTDRVPLGQDSSDKTRPSGRFPASFDSLADPQFRSTPPPHTPTPKPIKGILKTSSRSPSTPIRPSSAVSFETTAPTNGHRSYHPTFARTYSSISFNSSQTPAATPKDTVKPPESPSQTSVMSGKAVGRAKARDATAVYDLGASPEKKKAGRINGSAKKTDDVSDEGSSSSDEDSDSSSSDEDSDSEDEPKGRQNAAAPASKKKAAPAAAADSSDSESDSSDSDDEPAKQEIKKPEAKKQETKKPAAAPAATNGAEESSSEEESDSEGEDGGAKVAPAKEIPNSSTESSESEDDDESTSAPAKSASTDESSSGSSDEGSDEDSDEEMADAPTSAPQSSRSGMVRAAQRAPPGPAPSVMEGGFKLQSAQNMGHMASVLSEAKAKGDRVWLLTHPSTTPLNLEVQKILPSAESHRNSIFPNGAKLTYPAASDGKNVHVICK